MKNLYYLLFICVIFTRCGEVINEENDIKEIKEALHKSAEDWSKGDIEAFMGAYWKSEKLQFIGSSGITYGWEQTLNNYKKNYPTPNHTGTLNFNVLSIDYLAKNLYSLTGEYYLVRKAGDTNGIFTLIFKKIDNKWVIVSDHTQ